MKLLSFLILVALSQSTPDKRTEHYNLKNGVAISGYDPVSYFHDKPQKGDKQYAFTFKNVTYYFTSAANRELFKKDPAAYEPQYGGWCAYAMGDDGSKVEVDPETYKIVNERLYLFYNRFFTNTLTYWNKDEVNLKRKADENWKKFK